VTSETDEREVIVKTEGERNKRRDRKVLRRRERRVRRLKERCQVKALARREATRRREDKSQKTKMTCEKLKRPEESGSPVVKKKEGTAGGLVKPNGIGAQRNAGGWSC